MMMMNQRPQPDSPWEQRKDDVWWPFAVEEATFADSPCWEEEDGKKCQLAKARQRRMSLAFYTLEKVQKLKGGHFLSFLTLALFPSFFSLFSACLRPEGLHSQCDG